jgi:hypothetical protein
MSDMFSRVEIITGVARRRRFTTEQKLAVVALAGTFGHDPGCGAALPVPEFGLSPKDIR